MKIVIISSSLSSESKSRILVKTVKEYLVSQGVEVSFIDIRDYELPLYAVNDTRAFEKVELIKKEILEADGLIIGTPIYNFSVASGLKNLIEHTGSAWSNKVVGVVCAAGGQRSYMAVLPFINSLMLDFRCVVMPNFVYAHPDDFNDKNEPIAEILKRLYALSDDVVRFSAIKR